MFRSSVFDRCLEKATSQLLLEPDWDSMLQIVDAIRQNDVQPKLAVLAIRKKIAVDNPHVASYALGVLETCVKNCGASFHQEVATKECMEFLKEQANRQEPVKGKILELIQTWAHAFRNEPSYKAVEDTYHLLKMEGYQFAALKEADAMFMSEKAPEWKDGETCSRCRVQFGMVQRKHHCRNCGDVFCNKCSSKNSIIPKFGIEREVRVCDSCFEKLTKQNAKKDDELPAEYLASPLSKQAQTAPQRSEQEIAEEEELQLALALSRSEAETKEKERERLRKNYGVYGGGNSVASSVANEPAPQPAMMPAIDTSDMDPELARYLNRNYWQKRSEDTVKAATTAPSAPAVTSAPQNSVGKIAEAAGATTEQPLQNGEQADSDKAQFLGALQSSLEIFVNRMRSNSQRGRPIANDSSVQSLFAVISNMHPQLLKYQQEMEDSRSYFEGLQDKLTQLRDAREALDSLREEHKEKRRREMEELERQRQIQMMQKLEVMRQKKHEYLEMQRQLALQRLQEQEREMALRLEQQKQLTHMRQMQAYGYPQVNPQYPSQMYGQQTMGPQGMMAGGPGMVPPSMGPQGPQSMVGGYPGAQPSEGSPVHQMTSYSQPGVAHSLPPGIDSAQGAPSQLAAPHTQSMYMQPGVNQPNFSQAGTAVGGGLAYNPGLANMPSGYQPAAPVEVTQMPGASASAYMAPTSVGYADQTLPSMGHPSMSYTSMPPTMEYSTFNMHSMASSLPQVPGQGGQPAPVQQPPGPGQQYPMGMSYQAQLPNSQMGPPAPPPGQAQQQPPPQQHLQQQQPQHESLLDAQLICFD